MAHYWNSYLPARSHRSDRRATPFVITDLAGLPPAVVVTAGFDPLRDEGRVYAERLIAADVPTAYLPFAGLTHGFLDMLGRVPAAVHALDTVFAAFRAMLALRPPAP